LDYTGLEMDRARSSSPELPSISDLLPTRRQESEVIDLASSPPVLRPLAGHKDSGKGEMASPPKPKPKAKKYIVVRQSTDDKFWKEVDEKDVKDRSRAWRHSQVEILDLTGDD